MLSILCCLDIENHMPPRGSDTLTYFDRLQSPEKPYRVVHRLQDRCNAVYLFSVWTMVSTRSANKALVIGFSRIISRLIFFFSPQLSNIYHGSNAVIIPQHGFIPPLSKPCRWKSSQRCASEGVCSKLFWIRLSSSTGSDADAAVTLKATGIS